MTIVDKIINSIHAALDTVDANGNPVEFPVYYHDDPTLNLMTSQMSFPCAIFLLLTTGDAIPEGGQLKEQVSAAVFFVEPSEFDMNALENERIIDRCKGRAFTWYGHLNEDEYIRGMRRRTERTYDRYDDILTGFGMYVDITELQGWTGCAEQEEDNEQEQP